MNTTYDPNEIPEYMINDAREREAIRLKMQLIEAYAHAKAEQSAAFSRHINYHTKWTETHDSGDCEQLRFADRLVDECRKDVVAFIDPDGVLG